MGLLDIYKASQQYKDDADKKNKKYKKGINPDAFNNPVGAASAFYEAAPTANWVMNPDKRFEEHGWTQNPHDDINKELYNNQSFGSKLFNSISQTLVGEVLAGTAAGFSDIAGLIYGSILKAAGEDYENYRDNVVSNKINEWKEKYNQEIAPVYNDPNKNISNGGLTDSSWWFSNLPSIASSITLLIPSMTLTKGLSTLSKGIGLTKLERKSLAYLNKAGRRLEEGAKETNKLTESIGKGLQRVGSQTTVDRIDRFANFSSNALFQRIMENYQESRQEYNDMYDKSRQTLQEMHDTIDEEGNNEFDKFIQRHPEYKGMSDEEIANDIGVKSADQTFKDDAINFAFDLVELYGVNKAWKGFKNIKAGNKLNKINENAKKYLGSDNAKSGEALSKTSESKKTTELKKKLETATAAKNKEEINSIKKQLDRSEKFDKLKDHLNGTYQSVFNGSKGLILNNVGEGAEEAVNYMAQQEGTYLASQILGTEDYKSFDQRMRMYSTAPALWESAFWGFLGGIVFNAGYGKLQESFNKESIINTKLRENEVIQRAKQFESLRDDIDKIKQGNNIFATLEKDKNFDTNDNAMVENLVNRRLQQYAFDLSLNAASVGNLDLLKSYISDDNVRNAFVQSGIVSEDESKQQMNSLINIIDKAQETFDSHYLQLKDLAGQLSDNDTNKDNIVNEAVIQSIARNNALRDFNNKLLRDYNDNLQNKINKLSIDPDDNNRRADLREQQEYERLLRSQYIGVQLAQLKATEDALSKSDTLEAIAALPNIRKQIKTLENISEQDELANKKYVDYLALQGIIDDAGKFIFGHTPESIKYEEDLREQFKDTDQHIIDEFDRYKKEGNSKNGSETELSYLATNYKNLFDMLQTKVANDIDIRVNKDQRINNLKDLKHSSDLAKEWSSSIEKNAGKDAIETIKNLTMKYGSDIIDNILSNYIKYTNRSKYFLSELDDTEQKNLIDAIDVLRLTNPTAEVAVEQITDMINNIRQIENTLQVDTLDSLEEPGETSEDLGETVDTIEPSPVTQTPIETISYSPTTNNLSIGNIIGNINIPVTENNGELVITSDDPVTFNNTLYNTADDSAIDKSKKYEIIKQPILNKDDDNNLSVKEKGILKTIDEETTRSSTGGVVNNEENVETSQAEQSLTSNTTPVSSIVPDTTSIEKSTIATTPQSTDEEDSVTKDFIAKSSKYQRDARGLALHKANEFLNTNGSINQDDLDTIFNDVISTISQSISKEDIAKFNIESAVRRTINRFAKQGIDKSVINNATRVAQAANALEGTQLSDLIEENKSKKTIRIIYGNAFEELIKAYLDDVGGKQINGKYYINLTELMSYINELFDDNIANNLFDTMNWYINQKEVQDKYVFTDGKPKSKKDFIDNVIKSRAERYQDEEGGYHTFLTDIVDKIQLTPNTENIQIGGKTINVKSYKEAIDNLKQGDTLEFDTDNKRVWIYCKDNSGNKVVISSMTIPSVVAAGMYIMKEGSLLVDTRLQNSKIVSKLNNKLQTLNKSTNPKDIAIKELLTEYGQLSKDDKTKKDNLTRRLQILSEFENSDFVKGLINDGFFEDVFIADDGTISIKSGDSIGEYSLMKELDYIGQIWSFTDKYIPIVSGKLAEKYRETYLNKWFERIDNNYNKTFQLANSNNNSTTIKLHGITGEEFIITSTANPVTTSIAGGYNPELHKLAGTSDKYAEGNLLISGMSIRSFGSNGNTFVVIPRPDGELQYVNSFPVTAINENLGTEAKAIIKEILDSVDILIDNYDNNDGKRALGKFFRSILSEYTKGSSNATRGLFGNRSEIDPTSGRRIYYNSSVSISNGSIILNLNQWHIKFNLTGSNDTINNVEIYTLNGSNRENVTTYNSFNKTEIKEFIKEQIKQLQFAQNFEYLYGDNVDNNDVNKAAQHIYEDGKKVFIVNVDGKHPHRFESYSDFLLSQNCVNITTEVVNGSNMTKRSDNLNNVEIYIDVIKNNENEETSSDNTSPVEETVEDDGLIIDKLLNIINDDSITDKSESITNLLFNEEELAKLKKFKLADLLPKNIIFVEDLNENANIDNINEGTGPIARHINSDNPGVENGTIQIGTKFLALVKSPMYRKQARNKLIHEQLHEVLSNPENRHYVKQLEEVFNEFREAIKDEPEDSHIRKYLHDEIDNDDRFENDEAKLNYKLEEFLVESLTSKELFDKLNSIKTESTKGYKLDKKESEKSLFQKIADLLRKLFNWKGKSNTLYAKEWNMLNDILSTDNNETIDNVEEVIEEDNKNEITQTEIPDNVPQRYTIEETEEEVNEDDIDNPFEDSNILDINSFNNNDNTELEIETSLYDLATVMPLSKIENFVAKVESAEIQFSCR